jgi:HAD superfamily hydrolase (TIGR01509 family)
MDVKAVIFDMDGIIVDSEQLWDDAREELVKETGGRWGAGAQRAMMGMASHEWSAYVRDELEVPMTAAEINKDVVGRLLRSYEEHLPLLPGAVDVVRAIGVRWPLALASSSNREIIDHVIEIAGITDQFVKTVSSEEVGRGKPAPDVFLATAKQLDVAPAECVVIEDSGNGIRAGVAAGMRVVAAPNLDFPPEPDAIALAHVVVDRVADISVETIEEAAA